MFNISHALISLAYQTSLTDLFADLFVDLLAEWVRLKLKRGRRWRREQQPVGQRE